jgi:hypothetical protein
MLRPVTWQCSRQLSINPSPGSGSFQPTITMTVIGTWSGSWCPVTSDLEQLAAGAPLVHIDAYAMLPAEAGSIVHEGDALVRLDDGTTWEAQRVAWFPSRTIVELKRAKETNAGG